MQTYELTYIISPEATSEEAGARAKEIEAFVVERQGVVVRQSLPIAKTLSYPIKGRASGFFGFLEFQLEPGNLLEVKNFIEKNNNILRHMIIIKGATELKKSKRTRDFFDRIENKAAEVVTQIAVEKPASSFGPKGYPATEDKEKVELKDIDQKLEELLG